MLRQPLTDMRSVLGGEALPPPIDKKVLKLTVMTLSQMSTCPPHCYQVPYEQHENPADFLRPRQIAVNAKQGRARGEAAALRQQLLTMHVFSH